MADTPEDPENDSTLINVAETIGGAVGTAAGTADAIAKSVTNMVTSAVSRVSEMTPNTTTSGRTVVTRARTGAARVLTSATRGSTRTRTAARSSARQAQAVTSQAIGQARNAASRAATTTGRVVTSAARAAAASTRAAAKSARGAARGAARAAATTARAAGRIKWSIVAWRHVSEAKGIGQNEIWRCKDEEGPRAFFEEEQPPQRIVKAPSLTGRLRRGQYGSGSLTEFFARGWSNRHQRAHKSPVSERWQLAAWPWRCWPSLSTDDRAVRGGSIER